MKNREKKLVIVNTSEAGNADAGLIQRWVEEAGAEISVEVLTESDEVFRRFETRMVPSEQCTVICLSPDGQTLAYLEHVAESQKPRIQPLIVLRINLLERVFLEFRHWNKEVFTGLVLNRDRAE